MAEAPLDRLVPRPSSGRTYTAQRRARFGDLSPGGRLRLDAVARYLQDVSSDDTTDSGLADDLAWVVRRLVIEVHRPPRFRELLTLTTWCSGTGSRWAERRVSMVGEHGALIEAGALWVRVDRESGRPLKLADDFWALYGEAAQGRSVSARLVHGADVPSTAARTAWPLRFADFDLLGHVNNAATWAVVEEHLAGRRDLRAPLRAELEYRAAIEREHEVQVARVDTPGGLDLWLAGQPDGELLATARVARLVLSAPGA